MVCKQTIIVIDITSWRKASLGLVLLPQTCVINIELGGYQ